MEIYFNDEISDNFKLKCRSFLFKSDDIAEKKAVSTSLIDSKKIYQAFAKSSSPSGWITSEELRYAVWTKLNRKINMEDIKIIPSLETE